MIKNIIKQTHNIMFHLPKNMHPIMGPFKVSFNITWRCNSRCIYCQRWREKPKEELTTKEYHRIIDDAISLGAVAFTFNGGEPLLRNDILELIEYTKKAGASHININTNGILLEEYSFELSKLPLNTINVSLDTMDKEKYRKLRGVDKLDAVLSGIITFSELKSKNQKLGISSVITPDSYMGLDKIFDFALRNSVNNVGLSAMQISETNMFTLSSKFKEEIQLFELGMKLHSIMNTYPELIKEPKEYIMGIPNYFSGNKRILPCHIPSFTLTADPYGNVKPHEYGDWVAGNLLETTMKEIWFNNAIMERARIHCFNGYPPHSWAISIEPINILLNKYHRGKLSAIRQTFSYSRRRR